MFILPTKSRNDWRWSSTEDQICPLYLGRCFKYPGGNASRFWGKTKAAYLAYTMGWNTIIEDGVWGVCVDDVEEKEQDSDKEGVYPCGVEEGGDLLNDFKGVLITSFWTCEWMSSFVSKIGFEYIDKVSLGCLEVEWNE